MADYIDREKLLGEIDELKKSPWYSDGAWGSGGYEAIIRRDAINAVVDLCVLKAPAADVAEVKHGKWRSWNGDYCGDYCGVCGLAWNENMCMGADDDGYFDPMPNFCPNCGARMDGDTE